MAKTKKEVPAVKEIMSVQETADYMGLNYYTVVRYAKAGEIPAHKLGGAKGQKWIFSKSTIDDFIRNKSMENLKKK